MAKQAKYEKIEAEIADLYGRLKKAHYGRINAKAGGTEREKSEVYRLTGKIALRFKVLKGEKSCADFRQDEYPAIYEGGQARGETSLPEPDQLLEMFGHDGLPSGEFLKAGMEYCTAGKVGFVFLAGGGGTRLIQTMAALAKTMEEARRSRGCGCNDYESIFASNVWKTRPPGEKWAAEILARSGVLSAAETGQSKLLVPMTALAHKSTLMENLEAVAAICRDCGRDLPMIIVLGPTTRKPVMEMLRECRNLNLRNLAVCSQGVMPFIREDTGGLVKTPDGWLEGADGGGGVMLSLNESGLKKADGTLLTGSSALDWMEDQGVEHVILAQTDDAKDREVFLAMAGARQSDRRNRERSLLILGYDYPRAPLPREKSGAAPEPAFKIGSLWNFLGPDGKVLSTEIVEFHELALHQKELMMKVMAGETSGRVVGNAGCYMINLDLVREIVERGMLPLHPQFGKKETAAGGREITVTKLEYFLTDAAAAVSRLGYPVRALMLRNASFLPGRLKFMNVDSLPVKDMVKLAVAQEAKLYKDREKLERLGMRISPGAKVEISNMAQWGDLGGGIIIDEGAGVYFGGDGVKGHTINIGRDVRFTGGVEVHIAGNCRVEIGAETCFRGRGKMVIGSPEGASINIAPYQNIVIDNNKKGDAHA
ncbi:MAG: hypothetical protein ACM3WV_01435 [Bacillota bacterium]